MNKYFGSWSDHKQMANDFFPQRYNYAASRYEDVIPPLDFPSDDEVLIASYDTPPYEGDAFVLYEKDGKLYEVNASHCSCNGLEECWSPEETSWGALAMRDVKGYDLLGDHDTQAIEALTALLRDKGFEPTLKGRYE